MKLFAPESYWLLNPVQKSDICNGCGSKDSKFDFVPDSIYWLSICEACDIHDYMYAIGLTLEDKREADRVFLNNMLRQIEVGNKWLRPLRRRRALKYYEAVTMFGGPSFWRGKNSPEEFKEVS